MKSIVPLFALFMFAYSQKCDRSEVLAQNTKNTLLSNGCSKPAFIQVEGEEDFTHCCDLHDTCYGICGMSKAYCDNDFKSCMKKLCDTTFKNSPKCKGAAETYAMGTMLFGQSGYDDSQKEHCLCIPAETELLHYTTSVEKFYATHAPDNLSKVSRIVDKYSTSQDDKKKSKGFNKMWYDLHKKYTTAIGHTPERKKMKSVPRPLSAKEL